MTFDLRYCFSAPAMLRANKSTWEDENPDDFEMVKQMTCKGLRKLRNDIAVQDNGLKFGIDILFNAYTEADMGKRIREKDMFGFQHLFADSGGLQIVTAGKSVDDSLKKSIYKTQSSADFAMCFDEIPCSNIEGLSMDTKSNRSQTGNKVFYPERIYETSTKTARNIREQIETLDEIGTSTVVHYIIQGNTTEDMVKWFENGTKVLLPEHYKRVGGLALADTCMGNGPLESVDMLVAYHLIRKQFGVEMTNNWIHLLGVGSVRRLIPLMYFLNSGLLPKDLTISFDSTSFSMSYFMGRFVSDDGSKVERHAHKYKQMFHKVFKYFEPIYREYFPNVDEEVFVNYCVDQIRSLADTVNNAPKDLASLVRANITLTLAWQILGFVKNINKAQDTAKHDRTGMGMLQYVNDYDDYLSWKREYSRFVPSSRIKRELKTTIDSFFFA